MKWLLIPAAILCLVALPAHAQMTQVTAQVMDANGNLYVNCQWSVVFVGQNTTPGAGPYQPSSLLNGQQGRCDSQGNLPSGLTLADNINTITPTPSQWSFSICSASGYVGGPYCKSNMLVTVTGATINLTSTFQPLMPILPPATGGGGGGAWLVNGATTPPGTNLNASAPLPPPNGINVNWTLQGTNLSGAIVGDGNAASCLLGTGVFAACPSGGGGGGGVSGSGSTSYVPVWTGTTSLGNSSITATAQQVTLGQPSPLAPVGSNTSLGSIGVQTSVNTATPTCFGAVPTNPPLSIPSQQLGCIGQRIQYNNNAATGAGVNAGLFVQAAGNNSAAGSLSMGAYVTEGAGHTAETRAGYFEAFESFNTTVPTRRGLMAFAGNGTGNTTALNEAFVAQTGGTSGTNTSDYSIHCLAPTTGATLTTHACMRIEPQAVGVEMQLGAHTFAALPACASAYEGSLAAITDSTVTSGTVTGGGTNHVLINCNGSAWVVAGGSGGGGGSGTVNSGTTGQFAFYSATGTAVSGNTHLDDSATTATTITSTEAIAAPSYTVNGTTGNGVSMTSAGGTLPTLAAGTGGLGIGPSAVPMMNLGTGAGWIAIPSTGGGGSGTITPNNITGTPNVAALAYYPAAGGSTTVSPTTAGGPALFMTSTGLAFSPTNDTVLTRPTANLLLVGAQPGGEDGWLRSINSCAVAAPVSVSSSSTICSRPLPGGGARAWIMHCVLPWNFTAGSGAPTVSFVMFNPVATATSYFASIITSGTSSANYGTALISTSTSSNTLLTNSTLSPTDTTTVYVVHLDGVLNAPSAGGTLALNASVSGGTGVTLNVDAGGYCRFE